MLASCGMRQDGNTGMAMEYAKGLLITKYRDYVKVEVKNPWKSGYALDTYLQNPDDQTLLMIYDILLYR